MAATRGEPSTSRASRKQTNMAAPPPNMGAWNAILQWSLRQSDGTRPSDLGPMSEEKKRFLREFLAQCVVDVPKRMQLNLRVLALPSDEAEARAALRAFPEGNEEERKLAEHPHLAEEIEKRRMAALSELEDLVQTIDAANDFGKMGGLVSMLRELRAPSPRARELALQVLATALHNNPDCQRRALGDGVVEALCRSLDEERDATVMASALSALSALVRSNKEAELEFLKHGGYSHLGHVFLHPESTPRVKKKALSLLRHLWSDNTAAKVPHDDGLLKAVIGCIGHDDIDLRESALQALVTISRLSKPAAAKLRSAALGLKPLLESRLRVITAPGLSDEDANSFRDEVALARELLDMLRAE